MQQRTSGFILALASWLLAGVLWGPLPVSAQDTGSETLSQERISESLAEEGEEVPESIAVSEDLTVIGVVDEIRLEGQVVTAKSVVLRQLTFRAGDAVSRHDLDLSRARLLGLNGIYWQANFTWENAEEEGHIIVTVDLRARKTWYVSPSIPAGAVVGDRNFLASGDTAYAGYFYDEANGDYLLTFGYTDTQFLGGHNSMSYEAHVLDTTNTIRTDNILSTGESYYLDRTGFSLVYGTRYREKIRVGIGYRWDRVEAEKRGDPFASRGTDDSFYYSGRQIPDGNVGVLSLEVSTGSLDSRFFPTRGFYWQLYNEFSNSFTGSDFDFTRHTISGAVFQDIYKGRNVLAGRFTYSCLTGDPPDYELLPFDWQVRGYSLGTHRGKSLLVMNFEYRFIMEPEIFQGVLFADLGRSWDGHEFSFEGLEMGYGFGIRVYTAPFIPYNLLLRADYGFSDSGEEVTFGFNQFF